MLIYNSNGSKVTEDNEFYQWLKEFVSKNTDEYEVETEEMTREDFYLKPEMELDFNN